MHPTKVRTMMSSPAVTIGPGATALQIIDTLVRNDVRGLPVVDAAGRLLGIVTESDLILSAAFGKNDRRALSLVAEVIQGRPAGWVDRVNAQTAGALMTSDVTTVTGDDDIAEAARRLLRRRCSRLPVVDDSGVVTGVISRHDVLRSVQHDAVGPSAEHPTPTTAYAMTQAESMIKLRNHDVGRVAYIHDDEPTIVPVNYVMDGSMIVFRTDPGEKLDDIPMQRVAFETDGVSSDGAWSVLAHGHAREVTTALGKEYAELRDVSIDRRAPGTKEHWITIEVTQLSGRQFR